MKVNMSCIVCNLFDLHMKATTVYNQDEDFMRVLAKLAFRRGGPDNAATTATQVINAYRVQLGEEE